MPFLISRDPYEEADALTPHERAIERRARRRAATAGYRFVKSRQRMLHLNNHGGWMLLENYRNGVRDGVNFDIPLNRLEGALAAAIARDLGGDGTRGGRVHDKE